METSTTITNIAISLLAAQKEMGNAVKDAKNPFYKSFYADLNAVREATMPVLNKHGISVLQPMIQKDGKTYVRTVLLHESGEFLTSDTEVVVAKQNDPQGYGSGISYARRYSLQAFLAVGAEDDDAEKAQAQNFPVKAVVSSENDLHKQDLPVKKASFRKPKDAPAPTPVTPEVTNDAPKTDEW